MQYILLIYSSEAEYKRQNEASGNAMMREYMEFTQDIRASGQLVAGERLESVANATTVRVKDGKTLKTDGPFAETREQLGGFYIVNAKDLDEAVALAARIPGARVGAVEVRPIMQMNR